MTNICHAYLKTGDPEHGQEDNTSEFYLKHWLEVCVNSTLILVFKGFLLMHSFSYNYLQINQCQKFLKGKIHGDWADIQYLGKT